jgi:hypothetical protein
MPSPHDVSSSSLARPYSIGSMAGLSRFWVLRQNLWVKIGQFNGGAGVDFVRDGRTNKWCEAKGALAA